MNALRLVAIVALFLTLTGVASGCGGGDGKTVTAADLERCLKDDDVLATLGSEELDYVAEAAGDGGIYVNYGDPIPDAPNGNRANVAVERSGSDAKRTEAAYKVFAKAFSSSTEDVLMRKGNVVVLWDKTPTDDERSTIEDCL